MCGGEGTRLRPLTFERPKPCIPIVNVPSIAHLVSHLSNLGFTEMVLTLGYMGKVIEKALGDGSLFGADIRYVREKTKLGTAGSVKNARRHLEGGRFLVVGGDHVTDVNLLDFYRAHAFGKAPISIGLISIDDPSEFGIAEMDVDYHVKRFKEKPGPGEIFSNLASMGMYVCEPEVFDNIPSGRKFDFARDLFPTILAEGQTLRGWLARGNWTDVGSPRSLRQAERWKLQEMPFMAVSGDLHVQGAQIAGPVQFSGSVTLGPHSRIIGPVSIGAGTTIEGNVLIGPYTSIGEGCTIRGHTKIFSSSIYNHVVVGRNCTISGSVIDNDAVIGEVCSIENDTIIGPRVVLKEGVVVHSGTRIWPEVTVEERTVIREHLLNPKFDTGIGGS